MNALDLNDCRYNGLLARTPQVSSRYGSACLDRPDCANKAMIGHALHYSGRRTAARNGFPYCYRPCPIENQYGDASSSHLELECAYRHMHRYRTLPLADRANIA